MAERLGKAVLELKTDSSQFTKEVNRAEGKAKKLDRSLGRTARAAGRLGRRLTLLGGKLRAVSAGFFTMRNAAVAAAGIAGVGLLVKKTLDYADTIAKTADRLGVTTEELQLWRFAADKAGLSQQKLDKSLGFFGKVLGEARTGIGTLRDMLLKTDPALLKQLLTTTSMEEAFNLMMKAIKDAPTTFDRLALSAASFGRSGGQAMILIAKDGGEEWRRWIQTAKDFGIVISDDLLRDAEGAVDALSFLWDAMRARFTAALLEMAPEIEAWATTFAESIPEIDKWGRAQVGWITDIVNALGVLIEVLGIVTGAYATVIEMLNKFAGAPTRAGVKTERRTDLFVDPKTGLPVTTFQNVGQPAGESVKDIIVFLGENMRSLAASFGIGTGRTFGSGGALAGAEVPSVRPAPDVFNLTGRLATAPGEAIGSGATVNVPIVLNADMEPALRGALIQMVPEIADKITAAVKDKLDRDPLSGARP